MTRKCRSRTWATRRASTDGEGSADRRVGASFLQALPTLVDDIKILLRWKATVRIAGSGDRSVVRPGTRSRGAPRLGSATLPVRSCMSELSGDCRRLWPGANEKELGTASQIETAPGRPVRTACRPAGNSRSRCTSVNSRKKRHPPRTGRGTRARRSRRNRSRRSPSNPGC